MDNALHLRLQWERGKRLSEQEIRQHLSQSGLVKKLTEQFTDHHLFAIFRMMSLCEIPYVEQLPYTQEVVSYINQNIATEAGFSYTGVKEELVPCYNAMLFEAYTRLGLENSTEAQRALNWIKQYQIFDRNLKTSWPYYGICRHGGCMNTTPCYIGIGKTIRALITYVDYTSQPDQEVERLIQQGTAYMLSHQLFKRRSNHQPISPHITDIMFPQNYALSMTDLIYIIGKRSLSDHPEAQPLLNLLAQKQIAKNCWKLDYIYHYQGYKSYETKRSISTWISSLFPIWLNSHHLASSDSNCQ